MVQQASNLGQFVGPLMLGLWVERFGWASAPMIAVPTALLGLAVAFMIRHASQLPTFSTLGNGRQLFSEADRIASPPLEEETDHGIFCGRDNRVQEPLQYLHAQAHYPRKWMPIWHYVRQLSTSVDDLDGANHRPLSVAVDSRISSMRFPKGSSVNRRLDPAMASSGNGRDVADEIEA
jgi:hypothetical protein